FHACPPCQLELMETPVHNLNNKGDVVQLLQALERRIAQQEKQYKQHFDQVDSHFERMEKQIELCNRIGRARTMNSSAKHAANPLYPIPFSNSDEQFPATKGEFCNPTGE
ncbi:unnamed protein product, partial [Rhizoctonia solani]